MILNEVFDKGAIRLNLEGGSKEEVFEELVNAIAELHPELKRQEMLLAVQDRENKMNTSVASGIAVPHGYYQGTNKVIGAIGISKAGIDYDALDHKPVHFIFLIIMGEAVREKHLRVLNRVLALINSGALNCIGNAGEAQEVYDLLSRFR